MNNKHRKIIELIVLHMENKLSETQQDELTAWLEEDEKNRSFFQQVISPESLKPENTSIPKGHFQNSKRQPNLIK